MKRFLSLVLLAFFPVLVHAGTVDLSMDSDAIFFTGDLISGNTIRLYARVTNVGDEDVSGYVSFFQGSLPIGDSQVISVRAGGVPEEVYVDFVVPSGSFNVRAEIRGTDPEDDNPDNNTAMTSLLTPVSDGDRDGVPDKSDNCPDTSNKNQADADDDGIGDVCDGDDDNDTLSDDVEAELGTDPRASDTDGDGVPDARDAYPSDPTRSEVATTVVTTPRATTAVASGISSDSSSDTSSNSEAMVDNVGEITSVSDSNAQIGDDTGTSDVVGEGSSDKGTTLSPNAIFRYSRHAWNTFEFEAVVAESSGSRYQWDFGDGVTSSRAQVEHTYATSGSFDVTFRVTNADGTTSQDTVVVRVPFWTIANRAVDMLLAGLTLLLLAGSALVRRLYRSSSNADDAFPEGDEPTISEEDIALDADGPTRIKVRNVDS